MEYVREAKAIETGGIIITVMQPVFLNKIRDLIKIVNYKIPVPVQVRTSILEDVIPKELGEKLQNMSSKELNQLYRAIHYLKITPLRKCVAAVLATKVHFTDSKGYIEKKEELKLKRDVTHAEIKQNRERFPFMN